MKKKSPRHHRHHRHSGIDNQHHHLIQEKKIKELTQLKNLQLDE
ncbi:MAG: hypothetical protein SFV55_19470 [Haliscomenobacter sp.]|nr:hypothetical protein [Haliscomenobacter sp.]MDX2070617.1 hypothetical protein [Haliscomenobacter sp.]